MPVPRIRTAKSYFPYWEEKTPTAEEYKSIVCNFGTVSASDDVLLFRAPASMEIKAIYLSVETTIATSDTNYWSVQAVSYQNSDRSQSPNLLSSAQTTKVTGGTAITANTPWALSIDQNTNLNAGDLIELQLTKASSASNLVGFTVQIDYIPSSAGGTTTSTSTSTTTTTTTTTTTSSSTTSTSSSTTAT